VLNGNNNAHDALEGKMLMAQAEKLKSDNADQKGKGGNKPWKNKSKDKTDGSKERIGRLS